MAIPSRNDLHFYTNKPLTASDWSTNFSQILNWLTDGLADITVNSITVTGGSFTYGGFKPYTTTQRDALSPSEGWAIWNLDSHRPEFYDGITWVSL